MFIALVHTPPLLALFGKVSVPILVRHGDEVGYAGFIWGATISEKRKGKRQRLLPYHTKEKVLGMQVEKPTLYKIQSVVKTLDFAA